MEYKLEEVDKLLIDLIDLAKMQMKNSVEKNFFSKDLAEAIGVVISLAYGRINKNDK